ncbi:hypothetical protein [Aquimonas voraii]|uniref:Cytochrome c domain-containing protein n=1 Tax=Aquimonas voraii TaxID=265719 RepID=A0A1G6YZH6_9GAMM|nr:hypothetical protein [Aquimonas voraii]SDD95045.1 hypothetical protein SAMN04488509_11178 [Aquimonas voraii]
MSIHGEPLAHPAVDGAVDAVPRLRAQLAAFMWICAGLAASSAAFAQATGCDDLAALAVTPRVDYHTQIQPIWEIRCSNCHVNFGSAPAAELSLNAEDSWIELVDIPSVQAAGRTRVLPGQVAASYLFEKINCEQPAVGTRMPRGRIAIPLSEQALIRDWIQQGARELTPPLLFADGFEPRPTAAAPAR